MKAYYLFGKSLLPTELSKEIQEVLDELAKIQDKKEYLRAAYDFITERFNSSRLKTIFRFWDLWVDDVENLWNRTDFLHCTNQNYLLSLLLLKSNLFSEKDIQLKWTRIWFFSPHQYLQINVGKETINVDCWGRSYGIPFGQYSHGFNSKPRQQRWN
jgi:hypothetical protein